MYKEAWETKKLNRPSLGQGGFREPKIVYTPRFAFWGEVFSSQILLCIGETVRSGRRRLP